MEWGNEFAKVRLHLAERMASSHARMAMRMGVGSRRKASPMQWGIGGYSSSLSGLLARHVQKSFCLLPPLQITLIVCLAL